ncbi:hypothetical protein [Lampropedia aestuarii]|uniref:hypothetical protein n=1 Tax=Lampropedia aestuarii TaxID=2562762 RepID=UPI002468743E|nr:hypothetical protein [Lampropedia aestuarii]MDH5857803.1 hypothetical protein [Lampropedia aestuarii]
MSKNDFIHADSGLVDPHGEYYIRVNDGPEEIISNRIPTQGFNYLLSVGLKAGAAQPSWYLALFSGGYTPTDEVTAATFANVATEIVSSTNGYTETTRQAWTPGDVANSEVSNLATEAVFTIATTSSVTVRGVALLSSPVKGGTDGVLMSIARFPQDRTYYDGDKVTIGYRVRMRPFQA